MNKEDEMPDMTGGNIIQFKTGSPPIYCCNCDKLITDDDSPYYIRIKCRDGFEPPPVDEDAAFCELPLSAGMDSGQTKIVQFIVPSKTSEARRDGYDLLAPACSEICVQALAEIFSSEMAFADEFDITS